MNQKKSIRKSTILLATPEKNKLTVIIAFRNEGDEVESTVQSVRDTTDSNLVSIILMDDGSDDGVDYEAVAKRHNCEYHKYPKSVGPAIARSMGARWCKTEKFVFIDGHMRFYDQQWNKRICKLLDENPRAILCSGTTNIVPGKERENRGNSAACIKINDEPGSEYNALWSADMKDFKGELMEVPCVLGAFYAFNKSFWKEIKGLAGLAGYGLEEPFMSLKAWYLGGKCLIIRDFYVGHLYRDVPKVPISSEKFYANQMMLIDVFTVDPKDRQERLTRYRNMFDPKMLKEVDDITAKQKNSIDELKAYLKEHSKPEYVEKFWQMNAERHP